MTTSKGITLGAFILVTLATFSGFTNSAFATGYSDMADVRSEAALRDLERRAKIQLSKNFANEACDAGKVWIAHGLDNVKTNGELDVAEIDDYTCERVVTTSKKISGWSVQCPLAGGILIGEWYFKNERPVLLATSAVCHAPAPNIGYPNIGYPKMMP